MFCAISQKLIGLLCVNACLQRLLTFVKLAGLSEGAPIEERITSLLEIGRIQVERYKGADAWGKAFTAFNLAQQEELWELAVEACDVMFLSEGDRRKINRLVALDL
jgi:hypothetical protein